MVTQKKGGGGKKRKTKEDIGEGPAAAACFDSDCVSPLEFRTEQLSQIENKEAKRKHKRYENNMPLEVNRAVDDVPARNRMGTIPSQLARAEALGSV